MKQKQLTLINTPTDSKAAPALSKEYINPLTGSSLVEQDVDFKDLISSVSVKNTTEQTRVPVKLYSPINKAELSATFFPRVPIISFKIGIPDFVKFNLYISLTEDFSKYVTIDNIDFYPTITSATSSSTAYTESAKVSADVYKNAIFKLLTKYSLEEFLSTIPNASTPYSSADFAAKVNHFYERAEFCDLFFKVQLATSKGNASFGVPSTPAIGRVGIGVSDIDTRITGVYHNTNSAGFDISTIYKSSGIRSITVEFFLFCKNAYGHYARRKFQSTIHPDSNGNSYVYANFLEFTTFSDYIDAPAEGDLYHVVHIAKLTTVYGTSIDFNLYPVGSAERNELLSRFVTTGFDTSVVATGSQGPAYINLENPSIPYIVDNTNKNQPRLIIRTVLTNGTDPRGNLLPIPYRFDVPNTPQGSFVYFNTVSAPNGLYTRNLVSLGLYQRYGVSFNSRTVSYVPLSYTSTGAPNRVLMEISIYFSENPALYGGFYETAFYRRFMSTGLLPTPVLVCNKIYSGFNVVKEALKQFTLKAGVLGRAKNKITVRSDANKTVNILMPSCRVFLRRYTYQKVGKQVTYIPDAFLVEGILVKTPTGGMTITDLNGGNLVYSGYLGKPKDLIILVADFANLQTFYGFSLNACRVTDYVELARITI